MFDLRTGAELDLVARHGRAARETHDLGVNVELLEDLAESVNHAIVRFGARLGGRPGHEHVRARKRVGSLDLELGLRVWALQALPLRRGEFARGLGRRGHARHGSGRGIFEFRRSLRRLRKLLLPAVLSVEVVVRSSVGAALLGRGGGRGVLRALFIRGARKGRRFSVLTFGALAIGPVAFVAEGVMVDARLEIFGIGIAAVLLAPQEISDPAVSLLPPVDMPLGIVAGLQTSA